MVNVLVVDSDTGYQDKLSRTFQPPKFNLDFYDSAEAVEECLLRDQSLQCDVICVVSRDANMMAYDLCRSIRATPAMHHCPILMMVESVDKTFNDRALSVGVTEIFQLNQWDELGLYFRNFQDFRKTISGKVLLVEDSLSQQRLACAILQEIGLTVETAVDVESAWQLFQTEAFNLVITDLVLVGEETGLILINRIRQLKDERSEVPIIVMSGYQDDARKVDLYRRGISEFISKPVIFEELIARSRSLVLNQKLTSQVHSQKYDLEKKNRALNEFIGRLSHEFRNSINVGLGVAKILVKDKGLTASQQKLVGMVKHAADHQLCLVNDILDYLKIEEGGLQLDETTCNIRELPQVLIDMFSYRCEENDLVLTYYLDDKIPAEVMVDKTKLNQILMNLLGNAVKFTRSGRVSLNLQLFVKDAQEWVRCEVRDTGPGIAEQDQKDIFLAFKQTEAGQSEAGSTGLGLAICTNLAKIMGGFLELESHLGRGSRFFFNFPVQGRGSSS